MSKQRAQRTRTSLVPYLFSQFDDLVAGSPWLTPLGESSVRLVFFWQTDLTEKSFFDLFIDHLRSSGHKFIHLGLETGDKKSPDPLTELILQLRSLPRQPPQSLVLVSNCSTYGQFALGQLLEAEHILVDDGSAKMDFIESAYERHRFAAHYPIAKGPDQVENGVYDLCRFLSIPTGKLQVIEEDPESDLSGFRAPNPAIKASRIARWWDFPFDWGYQNPN